MTTCKIFLASGEPYPGRQHLNLAEAASIVEDFAWAWIDRDGSIIVSAAPRAAGADQDKPVRGSLMAARLRDRDQREIYAGLERVLGYNPGYNWQNG